MDGDRFVNRYGISGVVLALLATVILPHLGYAQVEMSEISLPAQTLEPGSGTPMAPPADLGDGAVVFRFQIKDVDPLANDSSEPTISCFLIQNLGTATSGDIAQIAIIDGATGEIIAGPKDDQGVGTPPPSGCPSGGGNIAWEAFFDGLSETIPDYPSPGREFQVAVRLAETGTLKAGSQNHTIKVRVIVQFSESVGSPATLTTFTASLTDSTSDLVWNGGINGLREVKTPLLPASIPTGGSGTVARFQICDDDAQSYSLKLTELKLVQGTDGNARHSDIGYFKLFRIDGSDRTELKTSPSPDSKFNRGSSGFTWAIADVTIPDDQFPCSIFEIDAYVAPSAMRGRTIHLKLIFSGVVEGAPIDASVAPALQIGQTVMLGSGVLRIPDLHVAGSGVPLEISAFPAGLKRIDIQTNSIQFDPGVIQIDDVIPEAPYQVNKLDRGNRSGQLRFTLALPEDQTPSAKTDGRVATIELSKAAGAQAGQRTSLLLQVDRILDVKGEDITSDVIVVPGSVTLLFSGDVDLDGKPTVRDVLLLAKAIVEFCLLEPPQEIPESVLSDEQKRVANVVSDPSDPDVPTCEELTASDVRAIAELALDFVGSTTTSQAQERSASERRALSWWARLLQSVFGIAPPPPDSDSRAAVGLVPLADSSWILRIESSDRAVGGMQGRVRFDPREMHVREVRGLHGVRVLASRIDNAGGEVRFVALVPPDQGTKAREFLALALEERVAGSAPHLTLDLLLDTEGNALPYAIEAADDLPQSGLHVQSVQLRSSSGRDGHGHWTLHVLGKNVASVRVEGFDLAGRTRFAADANGSRAQWRMRDAHGHPLSNGVYLYVVTVTGSSGEVWRSEVRKLVVLR